MRTVHCIGRSAVHTACSEIGDGGAARPLKCNLGLGSIVIFHDVFRGERDCCIHLSDRCRVCRSGTVSDIYDLAFVSCRSDRHRILAVSHGIRAQSNAVCGRDGSIGADSDGPGRTYGGAGIVTERDGVQFTG